MYCISGNIIHVGVLQHITLCTMYIILRVNKPYKYVLTGTLVSSTAVAMSYSTLCSVLKLFERLRPHLDRSSLANSMLLCHHIHPTVTYKFEIFFPHLLKIKQDIFA